MSTNQEQPANGEPAPCEPRSKLLELKIPPMIERGNAAYRRDLPELLKKHLGQWVAYHGDERIGFGRTETAVYQECFRRGLTIWDVAVRWIEPYSPEDDPDFDGDG